MGMDIHQVQYLVHRTPCVALVCNDAAVMLRLQNASAKKMGMLRDFSANAEVLECYTAPWEVSATTTYQSVQVWGITALLVCHQAMDWRRTGLCASPSLKELMVT